ncbi:MAG: GNAT family N-acetyltransferase [Bacteroidota bacterium]
MISLYQPQLTEVDQWQKLAAASFLAAFDHHYAEEVLTEYMGTAYSVENLTAELKDEFSQIWIAKVDDIWAGYLQTRTNYQPEAIQGLEALEIKRLYVLPEFLGKGIGPKLMELALQIAKESRFPYLWLGVWEYNHRALRFYEKWGFEHRGKHPFRMTEELLEYDLVYVKEL